MPQVYPGGRVRLEKNFKNTIAGSPNTPAIFIICLTHIQFELLNNHRAINLKITDATMANPLLQLSHHLTPLLYHFARMGLPAPATTPLNNRHSISLPRSNWESSLPTTKPASSSPCLCGTNHRPVYPGGEAISKPCSSEISTDVCSPGTRTEDVIGSRGRHGVD